MTREAHPSLEHGLYFLIFCLALALRLANLGSAPLTETEAQRALAAHQISVGDQASPGAHPGYVILTAASFALLGSSEFLARFWPALFGGLLVLAPYFLSRTLGRRAALLLALALALDPGMVALSRQASGLMLGVGLAGLSLLAWAHQRWIPAGILAAFALLSGPGLLFGALTLFLAWGLLARYLGGESVRAFIGGLGARAALREGRRAFLLAGLASLLLLGTAFLRAPQALTGVGGLLQALFAGWFGASGVNAFRLMLALLAYGLPPILFGLAGLWHSWRQGEGLGAALGWWVLSVFLLIVVYPGRHAADLIWMVLPLWILAARELARVLRLPLEEPMAALGEFGLLSLLFVFGALTLAELTRVDLFSLDFITDIRVLAALGLLTIVSVLLISLGWSREVAWRGFSWAIGLFLLIGLLANTLHFVEEVPAATELWGEGPAAGQANLLRVTLEDFSAWATGERRALDVVLESDNAALAWTLRDWPNVYAPGEATGLPRPAAIVSSEAADQPARTSAYRGQSFVWAQEPDWSGAWPPGILNWLLYREAPVRSNTIILWLRSDLFPDENATGTIDAINGVDGAGSP